MQDTVRRFVNSHVNNELVRALSQDAKMLDHINERFAELLSTAKTQENKKASAETQGEAKFQKIGINKDGIEVYEISAETKRLPFKERKKHFLSLMKNEYRGRTAKFEKNGQVYYAAFEDADIQKNIYGDKKSDAKGYKAKINAGADGDIFDLVEKSKYNGSGKEIGKQIAAHKNISNWDYFIKTVQIGKRVFDLVANVRRRNNGAFVYSIQLNVNKKITASPPINANKKTTASPPRVDNTATVKRVLNAVVNNSISNPDEIVKHFDEKNSSNPDEVVEPSDEEFSSGVKNQMSIDLAQDAEYSEYDKPITFEDVNLIRSIGRKSINEFTSEEIKKSQKWAYKFYKELGVKSPFFRAWFGDWREYDVSPVSIADIPNYVATNEARKTQRGNVVNADTGWDIRISREGETNTISHSGTERLSEYGLSGIRSLVENAVLLNSEVHDSHNRSKKNDHIAFDHKLYALGKDTQGNIAVYRMTVEEIFQDPYHTNEKRFHNLKYIEKVAEISADANVEQRYKDGSTMRISTTNYTISDLYALVKQYDKDFSSVNAVNPALLNEDGTPKVFYHGTDSEFTVFDRTKGRSNMDIQGMFFSPWVLDARGYGKNVGAYYLSIQNPASEGQAYKVLNMFKGQNNAGIKAREYLEKLGYDGVNNSDEEIIAFHPTQIKSATDNIGTFDGESTDVRFQMSADSVRDEELRMIRQDYEVTKLQNDLMRAKLKIYEHKVPSPKALRRYLNNVMEMYGVEYDENEKLQAFDKLSEIYKYLVRSKTPNMVILQDMAFDLARDMVDHSAELIKEPYSETERSFRRTLRETGLCISEAQKSEIKYSYGSMTNFRRATGGMIRINKDSKLYVADIMREAKEIYDIKTDNEDEFLVELIPYMKASAEAARGVWADPYQGDAKAAHMAAMDLSSLLLDALFDPNIVPARRTFADMEEEKRYRALLNQYSYYEKRMAKLNDRVRQARAEGRQAVKNERGRREAAIKKMAEHYAQMTYKAQERRKSSELKAKIARLADSMNGRLINPKKDRYIPQDIQQAIIPALELAANYTYGAERLEKYDRMIAAEPNEERRQRLIKTRDKIAKYGDNISSAIKDLKDLYDAGRPRTDSNGEELNADNPYDAAKQRAFNPAISELLNTVYNQLNGVSCKQMSSEQLQLLYNALRATDKVIRDSVNLRSSRIKMSVYEAGEELIRETSAIKGSKRGLASSLLQQNLNPESFFERLGGFAKNSLWMKTYDDLNDAQRDNKANQKRIAYRKRT